MLIDKEINDRRPMLELIATQQFQPLLVYAFYIHEGVKGMIFVDKSIKKINVFKRKILIYYHQDVSLLPTYFPHHYS